MFPVIEWRRIRNATCGLGLLTICCRPGPNGYIGVLRFAEGTAGADRYATKAYLRELFAADDLDGDGDEEVLASSGAGLLVVGGGLRPTALWQGPGILDVEPLARRNPSSFDLLALTDNDDGIVLLDCRSDEWDCETSSSLAVAPDAIDFTIANVDGDAVVDLVVFEYATLSLHRGIEAGPGSPGWRDGEPLLDDDEWFLSRNGVAAADVDVDDRVDIVVANYDELVIAFGNGDGSFGEVVRFPYPAGGGFDVVRVAELTGDAHPEILATSADGGGIVFENPGDPTNTSSFQLFGPRSGPWTIPLLGRFDDGPGVDLLVADPNTDSARLLAFDAPTSSWAERTLVPVAAEHLLALHLVADLDGDDRDEVMSVLGVPIYCE